MAFRWVALGAAVCASFAAFPLAVAWSAPPAVDGGAIFRQRCQSCHGSDAKGRPNLGPSLVGVVGRKAASTPFRYSPALTGSGLTWTRANLDRFLAAPARMVPGTRMVISVSDPVQRQAVINHLAAVR